MSFFENLVSPKPPPPPLQKKEIKKNPSGSQVIKWVLQSFETRLEGFFVLMIDYLSLYF